MPTDALYRFIYIELTTGMNTTPAGAGPFGVATAPGSWMIAYAAAYIVAFFGIAVWSFSRKDL